MDSKSAKTIGGGMMGRNKIHIPHPNYYPKPSPKDGDIGWCGALWCRIEEDGLKVTCKKCIKKRDKLIAGREEKAST